MTTIINFKEQTPLTTQERPHALLQTGCKMFTWTCNENPIKNVTSMEFVNEYTAFLSIKIKQHADDEWHVCLKRYRLMESPHGELGSNSHITLDQKQLIFVPRSIYQMRVILQQPSPIWKDFTIDNFKIHTQSVAIKDRKPSIERLLATTLINDDQMTDSAFTKTPSMNELSQHLQALWTICTKMHQSDYGSEHIKRFDIDGSYDLQILSYT